MWTLGESIVISLAISAPIQLGFPKRYANGRIFSRWLHRWFRDRFVLRMFQITVIGLLLAGAQVIFGQVGTALGNLIFWGCYAMLFLDDYLTGDDDNWRRFKEWAKNKIKWKMPLPAPARS
jgi:hypothetical protein